MYHPTLSFMNLSYPLSPFLILPCSLSCLLALQHPFLLFIIPGEALEGGGASEAVQNLALVAAYFHPPPASRSPWVSCRVPGGLVVLHRPGGHAGRNGAQEEQEEKP